MCDNESIGNYSAMGSDVGRSLINICNQLQSQQAAAQLKNNQSLVSAFSLISTIYGFDVNMDFFFMFILSALVFCAQAPCFARLLFERTRECSTVIVMTYSPFCCVCSHAVRVRSVRGGYAEEPEDAQAHAAQELPVHQYALVN